MEEYDTCKDMIWDYIKKHPDSSATQIARSLKVGKTYCQSMLRQLIAQGYVSQTGGEGKSNSPRLLSATNKRYPKATCTKAKLPGKRRFAKTYRQKLWNNIKIESVFSVQSITASVEVKASTANRFINQLLRAGYVERIISKNRAAKHRFGYRYRLIRDTGRLAPILRQNGMWDQNEQIFYSFDQHSRALTEAHHDVAR